MRALWISGGAVVWAVHFTAIYAVVTFACARGSALAAGIGIAVATIAALAGAVGLAMRGYRTRASFDGWMTAGVALAAALAILYESAGLFFLPVCR